MIASGLLVATVHCTLYTVHCTGVKHPYYNVIKEEFECSLHIIKLPKPFRNIYDISIKREAGQIHSTRSHVTCTSDVFLTRED